MICLSLQYKCPQPVNKHNQSSHENEVSFFNLNLSGLIGPSKAKLQKSGDKASP